MMKTPDEIKGTNPFRVPEKYFEEVNRKIMASTVEAVPVTKKKRLYLQIRPLTTIAASVAVLVMLGYTALKVTGRINSKKVLTEISTEDLSQLYLSDADIYILETNADIASLPNGVPVASKDEIIDYLLVEDIDINDIYEIL